MPETSIAVKLKLNPGRTIQVVNGPVGIQDILAPLPEFARFTEDTGAADVVLVFCRDFAAFNTIFLPTAKIVKNDALLWAAYPKKTNRIKSDIDRDLLHAYAQKLGWLGVFMIAIDEDWSAMRFRKE
jgi:uncharacterized repeat protein (TIGR03917 family)